jgi:DNA sulfur modification protein DndC
LEAQESARQEGPSEFRNLRLITLDELHEIRRIWLYEKDEFDDSLPRIYEEVTGSQFPQGGDEANGLRADDWNLLREVCGDDKAFFHLQVSLLGLERKFRGMSRRHGVFDDLEERLRTGLYSSEEEAVAVLGGREKMRDTAGQAGLFARELPLVDSPSSGKEVEQ